MGDFKFVGSQERIEVPDGFEEITITQEIPFHITDRELFSYFNKAEELSKWLAPIDSIEPKAGGKIFFKDGSVGVCTNFTPGKEVTLISDFFGECNMKMNKIVATVSFKKMTDDPDQLSEDLVHCLSLLGSLVGR